MMADTMKIIASIEWMALGILFLWGIRRWDRAFKKLWHELDEAVAEMREEEARNASL